jgi:2-polyprenyl-6-methoxyphenol hydroxylase-like FAD-dependent oxidoreductase
MSDFDVAVVGYGPTGMTLAALLGQLDRRVVVLERYTGLYNLPRAACFDDEIMRTFQKLGLADEISRGAEVQPGYEWVNGAGQILVSFEYDNPAPGGWAALYMMFQPHIEAVLDRHNKSLPTVEIRQGVTVSEIEQNGDAVTLRGVDENGAQVSARARFAVGADGGNGFTRRTFGGQIDDYRFQENWLVCDFRLRGTVLPPRFRQVCDPAQPIAIVNIGPGYHRFSFMLDPNETAEKATKHEEVWSRVSGYLTKNDAEIIRVANYVFRSRIVEKWRHGRVFLAGDAAHEMPPFLAQGMCSGIRDAHNLAWKLDLVLAGRADEALLDTYQPEREPHVRAITEKAIELGRIQTTRDSIKARERDERLFAKRRAGQGPEKLRYPGLSSGLVTGSGEFFPQGRIRLNGREALFDDIVDLGWCILACEPDVLDALTVSHRDAWQAIGGRIAAVTASQSDGDAFEDLDGTYRAWFADHGCLVAVIRPDWYLYGTAQNGRELTVLLDQLGQSLRRQSVYASA